MRAMLGGRADSHVLSHTDALEAMENHSHPAKAFGGNGSVSTITSEGPDSIGQTNSHPLASKFLFDHLELSELPCFPNARMPQSSVRSCASQKLLSSVPFVQWTWM
eukprot:1906755-Amphidinium_carterae.1